MKTVCSKRKMLKPLGIDQTNFSPHIEQLDSPFFFMESFEKEKIPGLSCNVFDVKGSREDITTSAIDHLVKDREIP